MAGDLFHLQRKGPTMPDRVEVDVADLIALRNWLEAHGYAARPYGFTERLVAAIPPPRLVPTRDAVKKALFSSADPRLQAAEVLAAAETAIELAMQHHLPVAFEDGGVLCLCDPMPEDGSLSFEGPVFHRRHVAAIALADVLDALAAGGDFVGTRPVCKTCGGKGTVRDTFYADRRRYRPCPDCVDGKLPTEIVKVDECEIAMKLSCHKRHYVGVGQ